MNLTIASLKTHSLTHVKNVLLQNNVECKFLFTNTTITQLHILHDTIFLAKGTTLQVISTHHSC